MSGTERTAAVINPTGKLHLKYSWVAGRDTRGRGRNIVSFTVLRRLKWLDVVGEMWWFQTKGLLGKKR